MKKNQKEQSQLDELKATIDSTEKKISSSEEKPTDPKPSTESSKEEIKPGETQEKNPKKVK